MTNPPTTTAATVATTPTAPPAAGRDEHGIPLDADIWCQDARALAATMDGPAKVAIWGDGGADATFVALDWSRAYAISGIEISEDDHPDALHFALVSESDEGDSSFGEATWDAVAGVQYWDADFEPVRSTFRAQASMVDGEVVLDCSKPMKD